MIQRTSILAALSSSGVDVRVSFEPRRVTPTVRASGVFPKLRVEVRQNAYLFVHLEMELFTTLLVSTAAERRDA